MKSIDNLIYTLEILSSALSARDEDKALEVITLLSQQFTATFGRATHIFLAILFLETLKVHILCEEFEEARGGALALLARLRAVNTAIRQSTAESAPANSDASADDVLDDVIYAETTTGALLPVARGAVAGCVQSLRKHHEPIPTDDETLVTTLDAPLTVSAANLLRRRLTSSVLKVENLHKIRGFVHAVVDQNGRVDQLAHPGTPHDPGTDIRETFK